MKLQKLLYFSQRESLAILNKPMFSEKFEGWKYGPVSREVRTYFTQEDGIQTYTEDIKSENKYIVNNVILEYGSLASWKLSEMTHKEISWLNSRKGLSENENKELELLKNMDLNSLSPLESLLKLNELKKILIGGTDE